MKDHTRMIVYAAALAALYVLISFLQNFLLPGTASMAIQFRVAEALCVVSVFTPAAIPGLSIGCLLFNLASASAMPLDFLIGSAATFLSTLTMYSLRHMKPGNIPLPSLLMPVIFNGVFVGWELSFYLGNAFWINALYVAAGEAAVMLVLGSALFFSLERHAHNLFGR